VISNSRLLRSLALTKPGESRSRRETLGFESADVHPFTPAPSIVPGGGSGRCSPT
jgi:hypothetical protein